MAIIGFARVGDRTTHGGTILTGDNTLSIEGRAAARKGDSASCPQCKRISTIITSRFPQCSTLGTGMAFDGDYLDCGAKVVSSLNGMDGYDDGQGGGGPFQQSNAAAPAPAFLNPPNYQEFFILKNEAGKPIANQSYSISASSGESLAGESDSTGRTEVIWTQQPTDVSINVDFEGAAASDDPYHYSDDEPD